MRSSLEAMPWEKLLKKEGSRVLNSEGPSWRMQSRHKGAWGQSKAPGPVIRKDRQFNMKTSQWMTEDKTSCR